MSKETKDDRSLAHTRWNCKYHIAFTPNTTEKLLWKVKS